MVTLLPSLIFKVKVDIFAVHCILFWQTLLYCYFYCGLRKNMGPGSHTSHRKAALTRKKSVRLAWVSLLFAVRNNDKVESQGLFVLSSPNHRTFRCSPGYGSYSFGTSGELNNFKFYMDTLFSKTQQKAHDTILSSCHLFLIFLQFLPRGELGFIITYSHIQNAFAISVLLHYLGKNHLPLLGPCFQMALQNAWSCHVGLDYVSL